MSADAALLAQAGSLSQGLLAEGSLRRFTFSVDLQHFQASSRLPLNLASIVLELTLPPELAGLIQQSNGRLPPRLAPLRTGAVAVARGSEAALPGGQAACDFTAGLMSVATLLARGPVMTVDVLHRERLTDDLLLGRAHVPLAPLLQESWVDGRAGVFALLPAPGSRGSSALEGSSKQQQQQHERVQVGTLHLVMSLEEAGPAGAEAAPAGAEAAAALAAAMPAQELVASGPSAPPAGPSLAAVAATSVLPRSRASSAAAAAGAPQQELAVQPPAAVAAGDCFLSSSAAGGPEFEAAWEVELWKRSEEATWRQELKQREGKRMAALEETWRRREAERECEAAALRSEFAVLEAKARQVLVGAEERERKVVAAEEAAARRRRELEREHAGRVAEAEAAVRRLQAECQHQLELEQQRREALAQQCAAAEQRSAAAEARAAAADRALQQQQEAHARSEAGQLGQQLAAAQQGLAHAEQRASKAAEAKRKYKEQVVRLAQEVALLQQQLAELVGMKRGQLDAELAKLQAEEAALAARRDAAEMGALKQQLHSLQLGGRGSGKENNAEEKSSSGGAGDSGGVLPGGQLAEAVKRLLGERELLLSSGAYSPEEPLIQQLDRRIRECAALAQGGAA